jgi:hypothetical protein
VEAVTPVAQPSGSDEPAVSGADEVETELVAAGPRNGQREHPPGPTTPPAAGGADAPRPARRPRQGSELGEAVPPRSSAEVLANARRRVKQPSGS